MRRHGAVLAATACLAVGSAGVTPAAAVPTTVASAPTVRSITMETPATPGEVDLRALATRTQAKPVTIAGIGPYVISGTESGSGLPYQFVTDRRYEVDPGDSSSAGWGREGRYGTQRPTSTPVYDVQSGVTHSGRTGVWQLSSDNNCVNENTVGGFTAYCSLFGPELWSAPFAATAGESLAFDWSALRVDDDYEFYGFLVRVEPSGGGHDYGSPASHTLLAYGRGATQDWTTRTGTIPADGTYRFRFVNGSYDYTGGRALGSLLFVDRVQVGPANPISFPQPPDRLQDTGPHTLTASAPGGAVTFTSLTPSVCTVSGNQVTLQSGTAGICSITADQAGDGTTFVAAQSITRSFQVLAAATAPTAVVPPTIVGPGTAGTTAVLDEGTWSDGASPFLTTTIEWQANGTAIPGETGTTCTLIASPGTSLTVVVTRTNAIGSASATSVRTLSDVTCGVPPAPPTPTTTPTTAPPAAPPAAPPTTAPRPVTNTPTRTPGLPSGQPIVFENGRVQEVPVPRSFTAPVAAAVTPSGNGLWTVTANGDVQVSGDATEVGDLAGRPLNAPAVAIVPTPSGAGYLIATADGGVFAYGDATFRGSLASTPLNAPVRSISPSCDGTGYYLVAADGGLFGFGNAPFHGSMAGVRLNDEMLGIVAACDGSGYWTFARDGGVFSYGSARFYGSLADATPRGGVIAMASTPTGRGYWLVGADRSVHAFGDAVALQASGTLPGGEPADPVSFAVVIPAPAGTPTGSEEEDGAAPDDDAVTTA